MGGLAESTCMALSVGRTRLNLVKRYPLLLFIPLLRTAATCIHVSTPAWNGRALFTCVVDPVCRTVSSQAQTGKPLCRKLARECLDRWRQATLSARSAGIARNSAARVAPATGNVRVPVPVPTRNHWRVSPPQPSIVRANTRILTSYRQTWSNTAQEGRGVSRALPEALNSPPRSPTPIPVQSVHTSLLPRD